MALSHTRSAPFARHPPRQKNIFLRVTRTVPRFLIYLIHDVFANACHVAVSLSGKKLSPRGAQEGQFLGGAAPGHRRRAARVQPARQPRPPHGGPAAAPPRRPHAHPRALRSEDDPRAMVAKDDSPIGKSPTCPPSCELAPAWPRGGVVLCRPRGVCMLFLAGTFKLTTGRVELELIQSHMAQKPVLQGEFAVKKTG